MRVFSGLRNAIKGLAIVLIGLAGQGCALSPFEEDGVFRRTTTTVGVTGKLAEPEPFVRDSRSPQAEYPAVGVTPQRPAAPHSADGVVRTAAELDQLRQKNEAIAAAARPASPYDGKIEPGFKPPELPPVPAYSGPAVGTAAPVAAVTPPASQKSTKQKPNDKKGLAGSSPARP